METKSSNNTWRNYGRHEMLVETTHDESARLDFMGNFFKYLSSEMLPNHKKIYENKIKKKFKQENKRLPKNRHEIRKAMLKDYYFKTWSNLRIFAQENTYSERRNIVNRQLDTLIEKAKPKKNDLGRIELDPNLTKPKYQKSLDMHWMPGSYHTSFNENEVAGGAMYDCGGLYLSTGNMLGKFNNGAAFAVVNWLNKNYPNFKPKRVLDEGCTVGHNTLPYKEVWQSAEVFAIDIGAPVLRYAHRRAESLGYKINFSQQNAEKTKFANNYFDVVVSTMFLHETSYKAVHNIFNEAFRILKKGGLMIHVEQPPFEKIKDPFDQLIGDWDTHNNNEPFWGPMHDMDLKSVALKAGFHKKNIIQTFAPLVCPTDENNFNITPNGKWFIFAAWK
tara:strand:+ start:121 stop:1290 length:1170 start_codon:yes stop_codon:yes gene_type:complete